MPPPSPRPKVLRDRVETALAAVQNPRLAQDVVSAGMVRDLVVDDGGAVSFTFQLTREDPASLARDARKAAQAVDGVNAVRINVVDPGGAKAASTARPAPGSVPPPPTPVEMPHLGRTIAVSSGKGGVGKSTVAANVAAALAQAGKRVGLMDADIYGPNIPRMFGRDEKPEVVGGKIQPLEAHGVKLMSLGFIVERDAPAIWRGPIIMKVIGQFLRDVAWGELDYFFVDLPPGTGDAQLSLTQSVHLDGAMIVYYVCPHCGERSQLFTSGGGERLAKELGVPLLGQVPLQAGVPDLADAGRPVVVAQPQSPAGEALSAVARRVVELIGSPAR